MSEAKITRQVKKLLLTYEDMKLPIYFNKISDRFTSGIPDYSGTFYGISFYIELKDAGEKARKLQEWHLKKARNAGAMCLSSDSYEVAEAFLENIRLNYKKLILATLEEFDS